MLSLTATTKALLSLTRIILHFRAAAGKTAKLPFKYQQQNSWKDVLNFTRICMVMKNTVLEEFKIFITMKNFSWKKYFQLEKSMNFYFKCHKMWTLYKLFIKKKLKIFFLFPYMLNSSVLHLIMTLEGKWTCSYKEPTPPAGEVEDMNTPLQKHICKHLNLSTGYLHTVFLLLFMGRLLFPWFDLGYMFPG